MEQMFGLVKCSFDVVVVVDEEEFGAVDSLPVDEADM